MEVDWDLHAVVRGCTIVTTTNTIRCGGVGGGATSSSTADLYPQTRFPNYEFESRNDMEDLHQLYKSFFTKSKPSSSLSTISFSKDEQVQIKEHKQPTATSKTHTSRSKRRKNIMKRVCQVPAESLSSDVWTWRKYGQKPIKGSPFPRGYYRCSTSKGCLARKQVDRNKSDPDMYIVTYTAEHNHPAPTYRNSLAGSTRQKHSTPQTVADGDSTEPADSLSPTTLVDEEVVVQSKKAESGEDLGENDFGMSDTAVSDDFFEGLEGLADIVTRDCFSGDLPASFDLPLGCVAYNVATAAGGI